MSDGMSPDTSLSITHVSCINSVSSFSAIQPQELSSASNSLTRFVSKRVMCVSSGYCVLCVVKYDSTSLMRSESDDCSLTSVVLYSGARTRVMSVAKRWGETCVWCAGSVFSWADVIASFLFCRFSRINAHDSAWISCIYIQDFNKMFSCLFIHFQRCWRLNFCIVWAYASRMSMHCTTSASSSKTALTSVERAS